MEKRLKYLLLFLISIIILLNGCTRFKVQTGVWVCEELGITVDFDDNEGLDGAAITSRATINIDGKTSELVCGMDATGSASFYPIENMSKVMEKMECLYEGIFVNKGADEMIFKLAFRKGEYTFVRVPLIE